jgi:hypothetical protein
MFLVASAPQSGNEPVSNPHKPKGSYEANRIKYSSTELWRPLIEPQNDQDLDSGQDQTADKKGNLI